MIKFRIIFRTCESVYSVHDVSRPFNLDKRSTIKTCFRSLIESVRDFPHEIIVLGDRLCEEMTEFFAAYPVQYINETLDNERSIERSLEIACSFDADEWVYFCEDDYLHLPWAFKYIDEFIRNRANILGLAAPLFIHPPDYPDRYAADRRQPAQIFLSRYCHWRQVSNTTFTFMAEVKTIRQYLSVLRRSVRGADDDLLSREIYASGPIQDSNTLVHTLLKGIAKLTAKNRNTALCVSPIPGLTTHMHEGVMTPLHDWQKIMNQFAPQHSASPRITSKL